MALDRLQNIFRPHPLPATSVKQDVVIMELRTSLQNAKVSGLDGELAKGRRSQASGRAVRVAATRDTYETRTFRKHNLELDTRKTGTEAAAERHMVVDGRHATALTRHLTACTETRAQLRPCGPCGRWPFRLLDLPPELRLWICRHLLAPTGSISLRSCGHHFPLQVLSGIHSTNFLRVCKLVNQEATSVHFGDNTIMTSFKLEDGTTVPPRNNKRLPDHVRPQLTSLTLVIGVTSWWTQFIGDSRQLQAMTS
ncbi:hypothetical protein Tdes44962_MAKER04340 [Teratosphaeria destructans]|uniref:Uncharacterized protein n=1 Tax=Teratosphaeria destructans TaxID=418781 RepID=A0A9W7VZY8_9PEZI|nr:hypothetical protein Tdes44962_MAKER04340 [Teratosphaeria destructans]